MPRVNPFSVTDPSCFGYDDGFATLNITGGTPDLSGNYIITPNLNNLSAGTYTVNGLDIKIGQYFPGNAGSSGGPSSGGIGGTTSYVLGAGGVVPSIILALKKGSLVVNSSQGGGTKDTWIVES